MASRSKSTKDDNSTGVLSSHSQEENGSGDNDSTWDAAEDFSLDEAWGETTTAPVQMMAPDKAAPSGGRGGRQATSKPPRKNKLPPSNKAPPPVLQTGLPASAKYTRNLGSVNSTQSGAFEVLSAPLSPVPLADINKRRKQTSPPPPPLDDLTAMGSKTHHGTTNSFDDTDFDDEFSKGLSKTTHFVKSKAAQMSPPPIRYNDNFAFPSEPPPKNDEDMTERFNKSFGDMPAFEFDSSSFQKPTEETKRRPRRGPNRRSSSSRNLTVDDMQWRGPNRRSSSSRHLTVDDMHSSMPSERMSGLTDMFASADFSDAGPSTRSDRTADTKSSRSERSDGRTNRKQERSARGERRRGRSTGTHTDGPPNTGERRRRGRSVGSDGHQESDSKPGPARRGRNSRSRSTDMPPRRSLSVDSSTKRSQSPHRTADHSPATSARNRHSRSPTSGPGGGKRAPNGPARGTRHRRARDGPRRARSADGDLEFLSAKAAANAVASGKKPPEPRGPTKTRTRRAPGRSKSSDLDLMSTSRSRPERALEAKLGLNESSRSRRRRNEDSESESSKSERSSMGSSLSTGLQLVNDAHFSLPKGKSDARSVQSEMVGKSKRHHRSRQQYALARRERLDPDIVMEEPSLSSQHRSNSGSGNPSFNSSTSMDSTGSKEQKRREPARLASARRKEEAKVKRLQEEAKLLEEQRLAEEAKIKLLREEAKAMEGKRKEEEGRLRVELELAKEQRMAEEAKMRDQLELAREQRLAEEARIERLKQEALVQSNESTTPSKPTEQPSKAKGRSRRERSPLNRTRPRVSPKKTEAIGEIDVSAASK